MKIFHCILLSVLASASILANQRPLNDPILRSIDGLPGLFDKTKVHKTLWLIRQIKSIHAGQIQIDKGGSPNPQSDITYSLIFKGEKQTIKSLINLENQIDSMSQEDQAKFQVLFHTVKTYFGIINEMMMADARGIQEHMTKLIQQYCRKYNRPNSILLNWDKNKSEIEMYAHDITGFSTFYVFTTDLMNFSAALIKSCPKALESFKASSTKKV